MCHGPSRTPVPTICKHPYENAPKASALWWCEKCSEEKKKVRMTFFPNGVSDAVLRYRPVSLPSKSKKKQKSTCKNKCSLVVRETGLEPVR